MSIVNDLWQNQIRHAPGYIGKSTFPTVDNRVRGRSSQQNLGNVIWRWYNGNVSSNYNVTRLAPNNSSTVYNYGRNPGNYWYNYNNYNNYNNWYNYGNYNRWYGGNRNLAWRRGISILDRWVTDANAWYQWTQREIDQLRRAAQANPEYARQLAQNYKNTGSFRDNTKSIDYGIPTYDENGNYVRESLRRRGRRNGN